MALPSIQTLRAFEAAGRHQSYSRAADELRLTHGAISHRIRELEACVGGRLFERRGNQMRPTIEGNRLLSQVRQALSLIERAFDRRKASATQRLILSVTPAFATCWLVPRLPGFRRTHPDIEFDLRVSDDLVDLEAEGIDAAVRYGPGGWPGVRAERITGDWLIPVCSPAYRARHRLRNPEDLRRCTLLRNTWQPWTTWLRAAGVDLKEPATGDSYDNSALLLQAAAMGEGVGLTRWLLALVDLNAGRLVRLSGPSVPDAYAYHLVSATRGSGAKEVLVAFSTWLRGAMLEDAEAIKA